MKIKVFILFMLNLLFVSCMKKERILVCEEDFLNNKIYMKIKSGKEIKIIISNADLNFLFSEFENLTERKDSAYIELSAKYSSKDNEIIIHNSKIRLPVLFYNEQSCTILSEKGAVIEFYENNNNLEIPKTTKYTVKSSEERIAYLVSLIENNLENSSVCLAFQEEQKAWELYKQKHLELLFPDSIDNVKMLWGSIASSEMGKEILVLNLDRIKVLENYLARNSDGTDGRGDYKMYVDELKEIQK